MAVCPASLPSKLLEYCLLSIAGRSLMYSFLQLGAGATFGSTSSMPLPRSLKGRVAEAACGRAGPKIRGAGQLMLPFALEAIW